MNARQHSRERARERARQTARNLGAFLLAACVGLAGATACGDDAKKPDVPTNPSASGNGTPGGAKPSSTTPPLELAVPESKSGLTGDAKTAYEKGWKSWLDGDLQGAKNAFVDAAGKAPKAGAPHYAEGVVMERLGDAGGAQQEYKTAISLEPENEIAIGALAVSLAKGGRVSDAESLLNEKKAKMPKSAKILVFLAEVKSLGNDHASAQQYAQDALRMSPDLKEAMVAIGRDHYRAKRTELAKYALQAVLEGFGEQQPPRDKDNPEAHLLRGLIFREQGLRAAAMKDFETVVARRPDYYEALLNLGAMRLEAGNVLEAMPLLEGATRYAPQNAAGHLSLGDCYRLVGRTAEAKRELETSLSRDSTLAAAHYNLGLLYLFAQKLPGYSPAEQVAAAIKEFDTYRTMRGPKSPAGINDDIDELQNRAKAKQAELQNAATAASAPAAGTGTAAPAPAATGTAKPK